MDPARWHLLASLARKEQEMRVNQFKHRSEISKAIISDVRSNFVSKANQPSAPTDIMQARAITTWETYF